jgi:hypothetical protein
VLAEPHRVGLDVEAAVRGAVVVELAQLQRAPHVVHVPSDLGRVVERRREAELVAAGADVGEEVVHPFLQRRAVDDVGAADAALVEHHQAALVEQRVEHLEVEVADETTPGPGDRRPRSALGDEDGLVGGLAVAARVVLEEQRDGPARGVLAVYRHVHAPAEAAGRLLALLEVRHRRRRALERHPLRERSGGRGRGPLDPGVGAVERPPGLRHSGQDEGSAEEGTDERDANACSGHAEHPPHGR